LKDFTDIRGDYAFFEEHSTEARANLLALVPQVAQVVAQSGHVRLMDFGCGSGRFTEMLLKELEVDSARLELTLVEPVVPYLASARAQLASFSSLPIRAASTVSALSSRQAQDAIVSNHVLYYVPSIDDAVASLLDRVAPDGRLLVTFGTDDNGLILGWEHCFEAHGQKVPYFKMGALKAALAKAGARFESIPIASMLSFDDSYENRMRIVRFMTGTHFAEMPKHDSMAAFFDSYSRSGRVDLPLHDELIVARRPSA
jgi:trans-aconitate 2-methyltransferase